MNSVIKLITLLPIQRSQKCHLQLDASLTELCVAAQSTNDIAFWFAFQSASGTSDPVCQSSKTPKWVPDEYSVRSVQSYEQDQLTAYSQWTPRTQLIPIGPLFPKATEVKILDSESRIQMNNSRSPSAPLSRNCVVSAASPSTVVLSTEVS